MSWQRPIERVIDWDRTLYGDDGYDLLRWWQDGRCAMCGTSSQSLVVDHCHESGLVRGLLCGSCNTKEPHNWSIEWNIYRTFPPCVFLGVKIYYNDFGGSFYSVESKFPRETVDADVEKWGEELCFNAVSDYCYSLLSLDWLSKSELKLIISKALNHYGNVSGVRISTPSQKAHRDVANSIESFIFDGAKKFQKDAHESAVDQ